MKKILVLILVFICTMPVSWGYVFAAEASWTWVTTITVTEDIPWMGCTLVNPSNTSVTTRKYRCNVTWDFWAVMLMLRWFIKYVTFLAILVAVLMLVLSGVKMSIEWKKDDKKMFKRVLTALLVLFSMGLILNTIAPWVFK
ncbi:MAG: hypothetical protein ACD_2C00183G0004 [uncultured bacterium (gcode 4)]|uniref:Uncharacterized protein n=1 Tax=uncultured bacterium (gcode 4) TaxID=1234023 RepID=K2H0N9_9BACT|nr:MAG: hypothetical protein ACD_2C00183G0004 [uncultured bacterium (gcode 4)]